MRFRLAHTQALVLLSTVLLTVLCMGALNAWNLRNGFSDFLASRDIERLEKFAALVSARAEIAGGLDALAAQGVDMHVLLHEFGRAQGALPSRPLLPRMIGSEGGFFAPPLPPIDSIDGFKDRVALYDPNGQPLLGKSLPADAAKHVERPVYVQGQEVAVMHMLKLKPVPDDVESKFLTSQYQGIIVVASVLLFVALMCALWVARHWVRPLIEIQAATEKIAEGQFDTRLSTDRADEIGDTMRNINRMAEGLQKLETSRRQWIADMSHELRTPLTVLRGEVDALIEGVIAMSPQALLSLREEVLQLNTLVDDLHLLAMADLRALPCYFEDLDAVALLEGIVQRFALRASQQGLTLLLQSKPDSPVQVRWDAKRMEQLLGNLLNNSLRYTDAPGQVIVQIQSDGDQVTILVEDTAPGLSPIDLLRIFEPLYRADPARGRESGGSGLGLAICQQIAHAHRGVIQAKSSPMGGVQFLIELPREGDKET
jgi:two-component system, OmpR family, sensor histidine kinase BaeS